MDIIIKKALNTHNLTLNEITQLLKSDDTDLYKAADYVCKSHKKNIVHLRGLIEFTNICKCSCYYCGLRCENKKVKRYRLTDEQILSCCKKAVNSGYRTIVLQGGEDGFWTVDKLCYLIKKIKEYDIALTLSIGERTYDEYKAFKKSGADRYLLRIETTDKELYSKLHPEMSFENRRNCLFNLKSLGYETGTGCLVGLPGQTIESLADDILFFKELDADMIGIGPFIPHPDTPLADGNKNNFDLALKVMSVTRLLMPDINIPATTAMETLRQNGRIIALNSGANVVMDNITIDEYKSLYEIYPDKKSTGTLKTDLEAKGFTISSGKGFRNDSL